MKIVVHDSSVILDLLSAGLLEDFFRLALKSHTTDLVVGEIKTATLNRFIMSGRLFVKTFEAAEFAALLRAYLSLPKGISLPDCSALVLSRNLGGILLTGDGKLRQCAEAAGVQVRGTLWAFDKLVENGILPTKEAARLLEKLIREGSRFPAEACRNRFQTWKAGMLGGTDEIFSGLEEPPPRYSASA